MKILRPGKFTSGAGAEIEFTVKQLAEVASCYDPAIKKAPICLGHPASDTPAFGWVESLVFSDGWLQGQPTAVVPGFFEFVQNAYGNGLSGALYSPDSPHNPLRGQGKYYLRHVGATAFQAVDGATFSERPVGSVDFSEEAEDDGIIEFAIAPDPSLFTPPTPPAMEDTLLKTTEDAEFTQLMDSLKQKLAALDQREAELTHRENAEFCQSLLDGGRQFSKAAAIALLDSPGGESEIEFSEGDNTETVSQKSLVKRLLESIPVMIEFAEVDKGKKVMPGDMEDPLMLAEEISKYAAEKGVNMAQAAIAVKKRMKAA